MEPIEQHSRRFLGNVAVSTVVHFGSTLAVLAATPFLVSRLGLETYGFWALMTTIVRYSLLTDVGIGSSVTTHVAAFAARGDRFSIRATTTAGVLYYAGAAAITMIAAFALRELVVSAFALRPALRVDVPWLLVALAGSTALNFVVWSAIAATLTGLGLYRVTSMANAAGSIVYALAAVGLLAAGLGLQGLVVAIYAQVFTCAAIGFVTLRRSGGPLFINPLRVPRTLFRDMLCFGAWLQIGTFAWAVIADLPPVLVGALIGVDAVALLDIGTRLAKAVRALAFNFNTALLPAVSAVNEEIGASRTTAIMPHAARVMGVVAFASMGLIVSSAPLMLRVWLGDHFAHERLVVIVVVGFAVTYLVETLTNVATTAARGLGRPWLDTIYSVAYALVECFLTLALAPRFGLPGVVLASVTGVTCGSAVFFVICARVRTLRFAELVRDWLPRLSVAVIGALSCTAILVLTAFANASPRFVGAAELAAACLIYCATLALGLRLAKFFSASDLDALRRILPLRLGRLLELPVLRLLFVKA